MSVNARSLAPEELHDAGVQLHERGWREAYASKTRDRHLVSGEMTGKVARPRLEN